MNTRASVRSGNADLHATVAEAFENSRREQKQHQTDTDELEITAQKYQTTDRKPSTDEELDYRFDCTGMFYWQPAIDIADVTLVLAYCISEIVHA